jgi:PAS domain S-box-containing protein
MLASQQSCDFTYLNQPSPEEFSFLGAQNNNRKRKPSPFFGIQFFKGTRMSTLTENESQFKKLRQEVLNSLKEQTSQKFSFGQIFFDSPVIMLVVDPESGMILACNDAAAQFYRIEREKLNHMAFEKLDAFSTPQTSDSELIPNQKDKHVFVRAQRIGEDTIRIVQVQESAISLNSNQLRFLIIIDITDHKDRQQKIMQQEERWRMALYGSEQGVWDWNLKTDEVYFSDQWKNMLGIRNGEIINKLSVWEERVHPDDIDWVRAELARHLKGDIPIYRTEHRVRHNDGTYRWILDQGKVISTDADGVPDRMVGTHLDITRRKRIIEAIEQLKSDVSVLGPYPKIIPLCAHCKKIQHEDDRWSALEEFISEYSKIRFSHGICPDCMELHYGDEL